MILKSKKKHISKNFGDNKNVQQRKKKENENPPTKQALDPVVGVKTPIQNHINDKKTGKWSEITMK